MSELLPPLPSIGTGLPAPAWLGTGTGQYAHYYPAGHRTSACGRSVRPERVRLAWLARHAPPALPDLRPTAG